MTETQTLSWAFGGLLAGQPPNTAWTILGGAAAVGVILVWWSYRRALIAVEPKRRAVLCALRGLLWLALLLVLAAPTRTERKYTQPAGRPLAVLVDHSESMTTADNRQRRRLDDALRRWREMEPAARTAFEGTKFFAFADTTQPVASIDAAASVAPGQTKFFDALRNVLSQAPAGGWGGIVTLTDGLDTSGAAATAGFETTTRAASAGGTALYFVPGRNRYAGQSFFELREFNVPSRASPRTTFRIEATFESYQTAARNLSVQFKVNGKPRPAESLRLESGRRLSAWSAEVSAGEAPSVIEVELRAGDEIARAAIRVESPPTNRILYFQGALDWSYRFLADILRRDASFTLTPVFNFPNSGAALPPGALKRMPASAKEFEAFDIVILANATATQLSAAQQAALSAWVRDGGVLLFFTPDDDSAQGFADSELEKMLPVLFSRDVSSSGRNRGATMTDRILRRGGGSGSADKTKLVAFDWEKTPRVQEIFAEAEKNKTTLVSPLFSEYAHVAQAKPGADILARHPTELAPGGNDRAILLAIQRYGRGQSGVLTTDALWRWKLNQPTSERGAEIFWQNLFAWLTRERQFGLRFDQPPRLATIGQEVSLRLLGAGSGNVKMEAVSGTTRVAVTEAASQDSARIFRWRPPTDGFWEITATDATGRDTHHWLSVKKDARTGELSGTPPDDELMRRLAEATGGAVLENTAPSAWSETRQAHRELLGERREPLWHRPWIFGAMLGLYCLELLLRRRWRLL